MELGPRLGEGCSVLRFDCRYSPSPPQLWRPARLFGALRAVGGVTGAVWPRNAGTIRGLGRIFAGNDLSPMELRAFRPRREQAGCAGVRRGCGSSPQRLGQGGPHRPHLHIASRLWVALEQNVRTSLAGSLGGGNFPARICYFRI